MNNPQVSIIVPVYKVEKYIRECVESILQQTFTNFELILIDDGSPDASGRMVDELAAQDARIRVFHQQNAGPGAARNLGLEQAKGEFINFVDADDCVEPTFLDSYHHVNADYDCVFQGFTKLSKNEKCESVHSIKTSTKDHSFDDVFISLLDSGLLGYMCLKQFRRSIIEDHHIRFDESIKYREDFLFTIRYLSFCKRLCITEDTGYLYRLDNPNSLLHTWWDAEEYLYTNDLVFEIVERTWGTNEKLHRYFLQWYANNQYLGFRGLIRDGNRKHNHSSKELEYVGKMVRFYRSIKPNIPYANNIVLDIILRLIWKLGYSPLILRIMRVTIR